MMRLGSLNGAIFMTTVLEQFDPAQQGVAYAREHRDRFLSGISPRN
jgi:hypothetical protein